MNSTIQFDLGGGRSLGLPTHQVAEALLTRLSEQPLPAPYQIGQLIPSEGGIFAGNILGDDGVTYGLIAAEGEEIGRAKWGEEGERDLSTWDGLGNTNRLCKESNPAAYLASRYQGSGFSDWYLPARRELLIAAANIPSQFGKDSYYWTSTPYGSHGAWAVDFEDGYVSFWSRDIEFRVRPVRRFTY